jgi:hypothetical protein
MKQTTPQQARGIRSETIVINCRPYTPAFSFILASNCQVFFDVRIKFGLGGNRVFLHSTPKRGGVGENSVSSILQKQL